MEMEERQHPLRKTDTHTRFLVCYYSLKAEGTGSISDKVRGSLEFSQLSGYCYSPEDL